MAKKPYPGIPPNYKIVDENGGYKRTCFVLELLSLGQLDNVQMAMVQEQLEATVQKIAQNITCIEKTDVVPPDRFDRILCDGLRISQ